MLSYLSLRRTKFPTIQQLARTETQRTVDTSNVHPAAHGEHSVHDRVPTCCAASVVKAALLLTRPSLASMRPLRSTWFTVLQCSRRARGSALRWPLSTASGPVDDCGCPPRALYSQPPVGLRVLHSHPISSTNRCTTGIKRDSEFSSPHFAVLFRAAYSFCSAYGCIPSFRAWSCITSRLLLLYSSTAFKRHIRDESCALPCRTFCALFVRHFRTTKFAAMFCWIARLPNVALCTLLRGRLLPFLVVCRCVAPFSCLALGSP